jgi:hypothetical protein
MGKGMDRTYKGREDGPSELTFLADKALNVYIVKRYSIGLEYRFYTDFLDILALEKVKKMIKFTGR